jgi:hypothetical protein
MRWTHVALVATTALAIAAGAQPAAAQSGLVGPTLPTNDLQNFLKLDGYQTPLRLPTQHNPEPVLAPVPRAQCGAGSRPLAGMQGRVDTAAATSADAATGWTCNTTLVSRHPTPGGFRVWRYTDPAGHVCAYYDTSLFSRLNVVSALGGPSPGVVVLDMADPAHPKQTAMLTDPAMLAPHESLNLNTRRGLLAAEMGNGTTLPGLMSIYDIAADCRTPKLRSTFLAAPFGHESGFAPDGNTFWIGGGQGIAAVDVSDPSKPRTIWSGNLFAHGLNLSDDGNTMWDADPIDGDLITFDVSQVQARKPDPKVSEISRLTWDTVSVPQNTAPLRIDGKPYLLEFDEFAFRFNPPTLDDRAGAARIIDIADPAHPRVVSNLRLEVNMRPAHQEAATADPSELPSSSAFPYGAHYCAVPREDDPGIVACSFLNSGLRVFDIRDPLHPKEVAYYVSPPTAAAASGAAPADLAFSQPAFDPARREIYYTDATTGFYDLRLSDSAWPDPLGPPAACVSSRVVLIHVPGAGRVRSATVTVAGRRVRTRLVGRTGVRVSLAKLPRQTVTVRIVARTAHGTRTTVRRYHTCRPGKKT